MANPLVAERGSLVQLKDPDDENTEIGVIRLITYDEEVDLWTVLVVESSDYGWHEVGQLLLYWIDPYSGNCREHLIVNEDDDN